MHGSSLYVCVSVYRCICMDQVYMYAQVIHNCMCIHYKHNMYWYGFHISVHVYFIYIF